MTTSPSMKGRPVRVRRTPEQNENRAWIKWLKSDMGRECSVGATNENFIANRLRHAFAAGFQAAEKDRVES